MVRLVKRKQLRGRVIFTKRGTKKRLPINTRTNTTCYNKEHKYLESCCEKLQDQVIALEKKMHTIKRKYEFEIERLEKGIAIYKREYEWLQATKEDISNLNTDLRAEVIKLQNQHDVINREKHEVIANVESLQSKLDKVTRDYERQKRRTEVYKWYYLQYHENAEQ